jgi:predicted Fe-Mo cluster-binding NifX family protein
MKILFSSTGKNWDDEVDQRFGRASGFVLYDEETDKLNWYSNEENINAQHGAGVNASQLAINTGANILVTGRIGPKAYDILKTAEIKIFISGNIKLKEAYKCLKNNTLTEQE